MSVERKSYKGWLIVIAAIVAASLISQGFVAYNGYKTGRAIGMAEGEAVGKARAISTLQERMRRCTDKHRGEASDEAFNAECMPILVDTVAIANQ